MFDVSHSSLGFTYKERKRERDVEDTFGGKKIYFPFSHRTILLFVRPLKLPALHSNIDLYAFTDTSASLFKTSPSCLQGWHRDFNAEMWVDRSVNKRLSFLDLNFYHKDGSFLTHRWITKEAPCHYRYFLGHLFLLINQNWENGRKKLQHVCLQLYVDMR